MKEILYIEVPTPDTEAVCQWLQQDFHPGLGEKIVTPNGFRIRCSTTTTAFKTISDAGSALDSELSVFVWSLQRTTYLKIFRWAEAAIPGEQKFLQHLTTAIRQQFPNQYPVPPAVDLTQQSIFEALA